MNRDNLYIVAGALLASTALSTAATAGTFAVAATVTSGTTTITTTAKNVSAQVFASTPSTTTVLGGAALAYRFNQAMTSKFSVTVGLTGARFNASTSSASLDVTGIVGTLATSSIITTTINGTIGCSVAVATDKILLSDCTPNASQVSLTGILVSQVSFDNATAMATAGATIALDATVTVGSVTFETTTAQAVLRSADSITTSATAATGLASIDVNASPAFSKFTGPTQTAVIGTIAVTSNGTLAANLSSVIDTTAELHNGVNIKLTSPIFADDALRSVRVITTTFSDVVRTSTAFATGSVTFTVPQASIVITDTFSVQVEFNGTSAIDIAAAGTVDVTYTALGAASALVNNAAPPAVAGAAGLAGLARNGLTIDINGIQPGTAQGARTYTSLLRIANTGVTAGSVNVRLLNEATGATLGTYTSPSIPGGASLQVSAAQLESGAGITPVASINYRATITGSINGYVQHVNWNQDAGFFSDLSGRRNSVVGTNN